MIREICTNTVTSDLSTVSSKPIRPSKLSGSTADAGTIDGLLLALTVTTAQIRGPYRFEGSRRDEHFDH